MAVHNSSSVCIDTNTLRPNWNRIPASIADVRDTGMWSISFSNQPVTPETIIKTAENMNAAVSSVNDAVLVLVASKAAPGVDQAVNTGALK